MTSIPQKSGLQPQGQSTSTQAASSHSPSPSLSGKTSPLPAPTPTAARSYASATKKSATDSTAAPVTLGGSSQHGKSTSVSPVSGKPMQQPSQSPGVTIVNGAPASASQGDHSRKPSVTITSAGTSGFIPNGGPASRPNSLQFGFANSQSSPNMGNPAVLATQPQSGLGVSPSMNPRVISPQTSPSPIPQPASSGGRPPPSSYQSQGNVPNFGSFGDAGDANVSHGIFLDADWKREGRITAGVSANMTLRVRANFLLLADALRSSSSPWPWFSVDPSPSRILPVYAQ